MDGTLVTWGPRVLEHISCSSSIFFGRWSAQTSTHRWIRAFKNSSFGMPSNELGVLVEADKGKLRRILYPLPDQLYFLCSNIVPLMC